jgi:hypothetical protein
MAIITSKITIKEPNSPSSVVIDKPVDVYKNINDLIKQKNNQTIEQINNKVEKETISILTKPKRSIFSPKIKNQINTRKTSRYLEDLTNKGD